MGNRPLTRPSAWTPGRIALLAAACCALVLGIAILIAVPLLYTIGERRRAAEAEYQAERDRLMELFAEHLDRKYGGTYYDGEFILSDELQEGGYPISHNYGVTAYRADMPELGFHVATVIREGKIYFTDNFLDVYIAWEATTAVRDTVRGIFGDEVLYWSTLDFYEEAEAAVLKRQGYAELSRHCAEDETRPSIYIVVFTESVNKQKLYEDTVSFYDAFILNRCDDGFVFNILYTATDSSDRGACYSGRDIVSTYNEGDPDSVLAEFYFRYNYQHGDDWKLEYPGVYEYVVDNYYFPQEDEQSIMPIPASSAWC